MEHSQLTVNTTSGFQQTGSVSWNGLASSTISFSYNALNRYRQLHIDVATVASARLLFQDFLIIKPQQQTLILDALLQLKSFGILGRSLFVGFGVRSVLVELAGTEAGLACIALCGTLTAVYDSFYVAKVLREIWRMRRFPDEFCPAIHQWKSLVEICEKSLVHTKISHMIEGFVRLAPYGTLHDTGYATHAEEMATAFDAIAQISQGIAANSDISGGVDCAVIAAFAELVLGLSVNVVSGNDVQYSSNQTGELDGCQKISSRIVTLSAHQICIRYRLPHETDRLSVKSSVFLSMGLLDKTSPCFKRTHNSFPRRSDWHCLFQETFGTLFQELMDVKMSDGTPVLLQILQLVAGRFTDPAPSENSSLPYRSESSPKSAGVGQKFLDYVCERFPELSSLNSLRPVAYESQLILETLEKLQKGCSMTFSICGGEADRQHSSRDHAYSFKKRCLASVAKAILEFCLIMSEIVVDQDLLPSPRVLMKMYHGRSYYTKLDPVLADKCKQSTFSKGEQDAGCGDAITTVGSLICMDRIVGNDDAFQNQPCHMTSSYRHFTLHSRLQFTLSLFAEVLGNEPRISIIDSTCAIVRNGVCVYFTLLEDIDLDPEICTRIRVTYGSICKDGTLYSVLNDMPLLSFNHKAIFFSGRFVRDRSVWKYLVQETRDRNVLEVGLLTPYRQSKDAVSLLTPPRYVCEKVFWNIFKRILCPCMCLNNDCPPEQCVAIKSPYSARFEIQKYTSAIQLTRDLGSWLYFHRTETNDIDLIEFTIRHMNMASAYVTEANRSIERLPSENSSYAFCRGACIDCSIAHLFPHDFTTATVAEYRITLEAENELGILDTASLTLVPATGLDESSEMRLVNPKIDEILIKKNLDPDEIGSHRATT